MTLTPADVLIAVIVLVLAVVTVLVARREPPSTIVPILAQIGGVAYLIMLLVVIARYLLKSG